MSAVHAFSLATCITSDVQPLMCACRTVSILMATPSRPSAQCKLCDKLCIVKQHVEAEVLMADVWHKCRDASQIPWGEAGADVICESTGVYTTVDKVYPQFVVLFWQFRMP